VRKKEKKFLGQKMIKERGDGVRKKEKKFLGQKMILGTFNDFHRHNNKHTAEAEVG